MGNSEKSKNRHSKIKKVFICIAAILGIVLVLAAVFYINIKSFTVKRLQSTVGQDIYLMGTFHTDHFDAISNYSVEEMLNAIQNINPDVVFIPAIAICDTHINRTVNDPILFIVLFSCLDKNHIGLYVLYCV